MYLTFGQQQYIAQPWYQKISTFNTKMKMHDCAGLNATWKTTVENNWIQGRLCML